MNPAQTTITQLADLIAERIATPKEEWVHTPDILKRLKIGRTTLYKLAKAFNGLEGYTPTTPGDYSPTFSRRENRINCLGPRQWNLSYFIKAMNL